AAGVFAHQHHGGSHHRFPAVTGGRAGAQLFADCNIGNVADQHRNADSDAHYDLLNIVDALQLARRTHQQLLPAALDIAGTAVAVVATQCGGDVVQRNALLQHAQRIGQNVVLALKSTNGVDFDHAGHL